MYYETLVVNWDIMPILKEKQREEVSYLEEKLKDNT